MKTKAVGKLCLADFVAWYNCKSEGNEQIKAKQNSSLADLYLPENNVDVNLDDDLSDLKQMSEKHEYERRNNTQRQK